MMMIPEWTWCMGCWFFYPFVTEKNCWCSGVSTFIFQWGMSTVTRMPRLRVHKSAVTTGWARPLMISVCAYPQSDGIKYMTNIECTVFWGVYCTGTAHRPCILQAMVITPATVLIATDRAIANVTQDGNQDHCGRDSPVMQDYSLDPSTECRSWTGWETVSK